MGLFDLFGKKKKAPKSGKTKSKAKRSSGKKSSPKSMARNEFRYNNQTKHPNYIFEEKGKKYRALGLTHSPSTFGRKNMPLKQNPDSKDEKQAYIRNGIISDKKKNFSENPIKNYAFGKEDMLNVKAKIRNYKKRRKQKKS